MKSIQTKNTAPANTVHHPLFQKGNSKNFFGSTDPFFSKRTNNNSFIQTKYDGFGKQENTIQRQEKPDEPVTKEASPDTTPSPPAPVRVPRAARCVTNPKFPDFGCFTTQLKLDVDENLVNNANQFYGIATLYPGDNELMWNTFLRYGLGVNLLQTNLGFLGINKKLGTILSYGTGIGMKSYQFASDGQLKLDIPIPLGKGINLDIKFDLNTSPDKQGDEKVNTSIGISGRF